MIVYDTHISIGTMMELYDESLRIMRISTWSSDEIKSIEETLTNYLQVDGIGKIVIGLVIG